MTESNQVCCTDWCLTNTWQLHFMSQQAAGYKPAAHHYYPQKAAFSWHFFCKKNQKTFYFKLFLLFLKIWQRTIVICGTCIIAPAIKMWSSSSTVNSKIFFTIGCYGFFLDDILKIFSLLLVPIVTLQFHWSLMVTPIVKKCFHINVVMFLFTHLCEEPPDGSQNLSATIERSLDASITCF